MNSVPFFFAMVLVLVWESHLCRPQTSCSLCQWTKCHAVRYVFSSPARSIAVSSQELEESKQKTVFEETDGLRTIQRCMNVWLLVLYRPSQKWGMHGSTSGKVHVWYLERLDEHEILCSHLQIWEARVFHHAFSPLEMWRNAVPLWAAAPRRGRRISSS